MCKNKFGITKHDLNYKIMSNAECRFQSASEMEDAKFHPMRMSHQGRTHKCRREKSMIALKVA